MVVDGKGKIGDLANSLTKEVLGLEVEFIPLFVKKTRVQFELGKGLVMMSNDNQLVTFAKDEWEKYQGMPVKDVPGSDWDGKEAPRFHVVFNFPALVIGRLNQFPLCLSMMRTAAKEAKKFISMACMTNEDFFSRVYKLTTKIEKNDKGTYAVPVIELSRRASDEEYAIAKRQFDIFFQKKDDISVDLNEEPLADENA